MNDDGKLEINERQRELLLQGLRYVRSSIALTMEDPTESSVAKRRSALQEVDSLSSLVQKFSSVAAVRLG